MGTSTQACIMLVDDDSAVREVTGFILEDLGYSVVEADCGGTALDVLEREPVDLMLVDFQMPDMDGAQLALRIREHHPKLPILFVTGNVNASVLNIASADQIVCKPFRSEELAHKLSVALGR